MCASRLHTGPVVGTRTVVQPEEVLEHGLNPAQVNDLIKRMNLKANPSMCFAIFLFRKPFRLVS